MIKTRILAPALLAVSLTTISTTAAAAFVVTYEEAGVTGTTASFKPGSNAKGEEIVGVERFDSLSTGVHGVHVSNFGNDDLGIIGTYRGVNIQAADQYGGASGRGNYAVSGINATSSYSISFNQDLTYFGFWLSALDGGNQLSFFSSGTEVFSFSANDVFGLVSGKPGYHGNPNEGFRGQNRGEPYVFLNFFADDGFSFDEIVFRQTTPGAGYESDNHTVGIWKEQSGTMVPSSQVPEPGSLLLLMGAVLGAAATRTLRRQA